MHSCLKCGEILDSADALCRVCDGEAAGPAPAAIPSAEDALAGVGALEADASAISHPAAQPRTWTPRHTIAAIAAAAMVIALAVIAMDNRSIASVARGVEQASILEVASPRHVAPAARVHTWTDANSARWVSNYRRSIAFELPAENTASGWMTRVRPVLVVRCLSNTTDAFVFTQLPAAIEPLDDRRTVQIGFDDDVASPERWAGSPDHDALFAPDGVALARRIARARTMRFVFTPHNSPPATIEFNVEGFSAHVGSVARLCRWK